MVSCSWFLVSLSSSGNGLVNSFGEQGRSSKLAGTSYAAPVVSGLAALIRSRFPKLTARQVMQRIEATAHHPPGGWDPRVGAGVVDFLAAVSTDPPASPSPPPSRTPVPIEPPPLPAPANHGSRDTAFLGAAILGGLLVVMLVTAALTARLRRD